MEGETNTLNMASRQNQILRVREPGGGGERANGKESGNKGDQEEGAKRARG